MHVDEQGVPVHPGAGGADGLAAAEQLVRSGDPMMEAEVQPRFACPIFAGQPQGSGFAPQFKAGAGEAVSVGLQPVGAAVDCRRHNRIRRSGRQ
ncbi:hypothetical protein D3C75_1004610 [compost metagenome]